MTAGRAASDVRSPGQHQFGSMVSTIDEVVDDQFERLRGNPVADAVFVTASHLGDWSTIWHLVGITRAITSPRRARQSVVLAALIGAESLIVNQGVKRIFRRERPTVAGAEGLRVRQPSTSSFPSGHASAAAFAAVVLTGFDGRRSAPLWWTLAAIVGVSRMHVRIHHASDIVAGAAVGAALGAAARRVAHRLGA